jgi:hypothetical protein
MTKLSKDEYQDIKELALFLVSEKENLDRYPTLKQQYENWVNILYKILRDNKDSM